MVAASGYVSIVRTVGRPTPVDPWESGMVVEASRVLHGLPLYEAPDAPAGHATQMYGALTPYLLAPFVAAAGPRVLAYRVFTLASGLLLALLLALMLRALLGRGGMFVAIVAGLLLATNRELALLFTRGSADLAAWLTAFLGLVACERLERSSRPRWALLAVALLSVAPFLKQTAVVASLVPLGALLLRHSAPRRAWTFALLLPIVVSLPLATLRWSAPLVHHYMIDAPSRFGFDLARGADATLAFLGSLALFWIALLAHLLHRDRVEGGESDEERAERWALATFAVTLVPSVLFVAKVGGYAQGWFAASTAALVFAAIQLPRAEQWLTDPDRPLRLRLGLATACLGGLLGFFPGVLRTFWRAAPDPPRARLVAAVRALPAGRVASPIDPLVPLEARGRHVGNLLFELDAAPEGGRYPSRLPPHTRAELLTADYVVQMASTSGALGRSLPLADDSLRALGFRPLAPFGPYVLWGRTAAPARPLALPERGR